MLKTSAYAAYNSTEPLKPFSFDYPAIKENEVAIDILYCGICHSDVHSARNEWKGANYPMVPGHEILGRVREVGAMVKKFKQGDIVGVGCLVGSCQHCGECSDGLEQYCDKSIFTYNSHSERFNRMTYGGYAKHIVVDEHFVLSIPAGMNLAKTAPLLCAGITVYSPMRHWNVKAGDRVGIIGIGGLGHVAVKIAKAMGAHVVVFTTSENKVAEAKNLGADEVVISKNAAAMQAQNNQFSFILSTVAAPHNLDPYITLLKRDGAIVFVGLPSENHPPAYMGNFIFKRRTMAGSLIGGVKETQEMLEFCAKHHITADIELIAMSDVNEAYDRIVNNDVKYRFVIDMSTLS
ncbi:MAG: NAD(P)-dependent alcohol dehydrogenase [Pseudomonadota bacterium]